MVAVTAAAAELIRAVIEARGAQGRGGLHVWMPRELSDNTAERGGLSVDLEVVAAPPAANTEQQLVGEQGSRLFLDPDVADYLRTRTLDTIQDQDGQQRFVVTRATAAGS